MTLEELSKEVGDLRRRLNIAETKLSQQAGQFEFITGQLRDVQLYMHARFDDIDKQLAEVKSDIRGIKTDIVGMKADISGMKTDISGMKADISGMKADISGMKAEITALPRVIAELIANR